MPRKGWSRILAVILATLVVIYAVKLASHALATRRAAEIEHDLATDVARLDAEVVALETAQAEAGSPDQVEDWARADQGWARPGDHPIVLVTAAPVTATPAPTATPAASAWRRLVEWVSGGR